MSSLVIVAIPEEQDRVWKISSEPVPHLTLLYLGDDVSKIQNLDQIMQFVEHAVTLSEHGPFYLDVERRGTLGDAEADVLFFNKRSWNLKWIRQFRGQLLQNQAIRTAFDSTQQILEAPQEWLPHLTLGYPETPAKADPNEEPFGHPLYSVCFDRIAVWAEKDNGPEFQLEWPERELEGDLALAYADQQKAALVHSGRLNAPVAATALDRGDEFILEHFGKKGMKWGIRNDRQGRNRLTPEGHSVGGDVARAALFPSPTNVPALIRLGKRYQMHRVVKKDATWEKNVYTLPEGIKRHNAMADRVNAELPSLNNRPQFKDVNFNKLGDDHPTTQRYYSEFNKIQERAFREATKEVHGKSPSGKREAVVERDPTDDTLKVTIRNTSEAKHAAGDADEVLLFKISRNAKGFITKTEPLQLEEEVPKTTIHGEAFVEGLVHGASSAGEEFILEHFGIKGMRWGFRKGPPEAVAPTATSRVPHGSRRKTKIDTEGGQNHSAHSDAIKVAEARTKLKKSGPAALSNLELREVANRLQLENQVDVLTSSKAKLFVTRQLQNEGSNLARAGVREGLKKGAKRAGTAATATAALLV